MEAWKDCKEGAYDGAAWEAQAYCMGTGESVGVGSRSVKSGEACHQLTWNSNENDCVGSKENQVHCRDLVVAPDSVVWQFISKKGIVKSFDQKRNALKWRKKPGV